VPYQNDSGVQALPEGIKKSRDFPGARISVDTRAGEG
jgi:hypothetical protein